MSDFIDNYEDKRIQYVEIDFLKKQLEVYKKLYRKRNYQLRIAWEALYHYSSKILDDFDNKDTETADKAIKQIQDREDKQDD